MDKDDAGFFGYDKAEKRRNTWCIPSFDNEVRAEKRQVRLFRLFLNSALLFIFEHTLCGSESRFALFHQQRRQEA